MRRSSDDTIDHLNKDQLSRRIAALDEEIDWLKEVEREYKESLAELEEGEKLFNKKEEE